MPSVLFSPLSVGPVTLSNRVVVAPMCQYSADDGCMNDWHLMNLGGFALSGAGLVVVEATAVTREGRISHGCTGLYSDNSEAAMRRVLQFCRRHSKAAFGVQLAHAGRKGSALRPWEGSRGLAPEQSPWRSEAPSPISHGEGWPVPHELTPGELQRLVDAFAAATRRALAVGFDLLELHAAHGYLLHEFLSPLANQRKDAYGTDRMKFPLEVARAVRESWPRDRALGARITGSDWAPGGIEPADAVALAKALKATGFDFVCVSSGGLVPPKAMRTVPGYNVPFAAQVGKEAGLLTRVGGMIVDPLHAEEIVASGKADHVALARAFLDNPRWAWHAAEKLGARVDYPPPYSRSAPAVWPGTKIARPA